MMRSRRKTGWRLAACTLLVLPSPVVLGSVASANCLTTLHAAPQAVQPGGTVALSGANYRGGPFVDGVEIRLDRRNNPVIATIPNLILENSPMRLTGFPVTIPVGTSPGYHILIASQRNSSGQQVSCGPGRTNIQVVPAAGSTNAGSIAGAAAAGPHDTDLGLAPARRTEPIVAPDQAVVLGVLAMVGMLLLRRRRFVPADGALAHLSL